MTQFNPRIWGPFAWMLLHRASFSFDSIGSAREFFDALPRILPCEQCRENLTNHKKVLPFPKNKSQIGHWVYDLHNRVNDSTKVAADARPSFEEVVAKYKGVHPRPEEWKFLSYIVLSHPGKANASAEYLQSLHTFLRVWLGTGVAQDAGKKPVLPSEDEVARKTKLMAWLKQYAPTAARRQHRTATSSICNAEMCALRS